MRPGRLQNRALLLLHIQRTGHGRGAIKVRTDDAVSPRAARFADASRRAKTCPTVTVRRAIRVCRSWLAQPSPGVVAVGSRVHACPSTRIALPPRIPAISASAYFRLISASVKSNMRFG